MPVLVTTSSIVMYRVVVAAYGYGAAYGSYWVGAPYWPGAPYCGWGHPGAVWPLTERAKPRPKAGLLLGIDISSRNVTVRGVTQSCTPLGPVNVLTTGCVPCRPQSPPRGRTEGGTSCEPPRPPSA